MSQAQGMEEGMDPSRDTIVEVHDVTVTFDMDRGQSRVLDNVNLEIRRNEVLGVVGESGSGKSMFASALLDAVVAPGQLTGNVTYHPKDGDPVNVLNLSKKELRKFRWEEIAMVFQGALSSFNPTMTIGGHFEETLEAHNANIKEGMERARELLSDLYLDPERALASYPHELSGGMKQRALIALSLVLEPEVLVLDEPTAALDLLMQRSILQLLDDLQEKYDITLVFITHDLPLVTELSDRTAVMYAFEFVEVGPTQEILHDASHPYTRSLLNATPNLSAPVEKMRPITGESPDPVNVPDGCSYHPRCPLADDQCRQEDPSMFDVNDEHESACFHIDDVAEEMPLTYQLQEDFDDGGAYDSVRRADRETVLSLEDVEVHFEENTGLLWFGETQWVRAVDGVSIELRENDVLALVGESGCGKTTLGKAAIGLQEPTAGSIKYRGVDIWEAKERRSLLPISITGRDEGEIPFSDIRKALQIIHQDPGSSINSHQKVITSLEFPLKKRRPDYNAAERRKEIFEMLETVGMSPPEDYAERYPHQLSGGEKQRVALIRALLMNPDAILADEAISALDVSLRVEMMDLFLGLQDEYQTSYLFISHDLANARYLAEQADGRIGVMYLGQLVEIGTPEQIIKDPRHPYTQALRWATPELGRVTDQDELPMRKIDIPDPRNPPSGCRFHTRCPEARETCRLYSPDEYEVEGQDRTVTCFREDSDHEYWESESLADEAATMDNQ